MIEFSPSGELAAFTIPMDKKLLIQFDNVCRNCLGISPEEAIRSTIYQVLMQSAQMRERE